MREQKGISKIDDGTYICHDCGSTWTDKDKWLLFPVSFGFSRNFSMFSIGIHGSEVESRGFARRTFKTIISLGWIKIILGRGFKSPVQYDQSTGKWNFRKNKPADS